MPILTNLIFHLVLKMLIIYLILVYLSRTIIYYPYLYLKYNSYNRGGFAKVKLAFNENEQQYYAIKIANKKKMKRKLLTRTTSVYTLLEKEIATMKKLVI